MIQGEHQAQAQAWQKQHLNKIQKYLTERQQELVRRNPGSLWAVARAIKIAIKACQYEMRNELWDCPTYGFSVRPSETFGMLMSRNFKETSFVQSLLSAAIAHSVSRACTESIITTCSRKQLPHGNGFGEDIEFGRQFARDFMDYSRTDAMPTNDYLNSNNISHDKLSPNSIMAGSSGGGNGASRSINSASSSNGNIIEYKDHHWRERRLRQMINAHNDEVGRLVSTLRLFASCDVFCLTVTVVGCSFVRLVGIWARRHHATFISCALWSCFGQICVIPQTSVAVCCNDCGFLVVVRSKLNTLKV